MASARFLRLMQLGDSALPSGGYAFSNGLEAAYRTGLIRDAADFESCLADQLHQLRMGELPFVHACYAPTSLDRTYFVDLVAFYDAMQLVPAIRTGSEILGRNWVRLIDQLEAHDAAERLHGWLVEADLPAHLTPILGATVRASGMAEAEAMLLFVHQFIRDQVSAAVRLGICGPMEGAGIHRRVLAEAESLEEAKIPYTEASRWLANWDVAQARHGELYTRLFQN